MLGTRSLLAFAFRAAVLLLLAPLAWLAVAAPYNELLAGLAGRLTPGATVDAAGRHILIAVEGRAAPLAVDGFILHYGAVLLAVLVLAAVRIGAASRARWLAGLAAGCAALHVLGLAALAQGLAWSAAAGQDGGVAFRLSAATWGLLPAAAGGAWCLLYWLPRASQQAPAAQDGRRPEVRSADSRFRGNDDLC